MTNLRITSLTHKGMERDHNEDNHIFNPDLSKKEWNFYEHCSVEGLSDQGALLVVADGMGGLNAGEVASQLGVEAIRQYFDQILTSEITRNPTAVQNFLAASIAYAHTAIVSHQVIHKDTEGMGTTVVIAWIIGNHLFTSWCGDSRCYKYHADTGLQQISRDHSYVQELVDKGVITREQAFYHPQTNIITQSLGDESHRPKPGFASAELVAGDRILLCSDGLNSMIQDVNIRELIQANAEIQSCAEVLIESANKAGGSDNITVMLCDVEKVSEGNTRLTKTAVSNHAKPKNSLQKVLFIGIPTLVAAGIFLLNSHTCQRNDQNQQPVLNTDTTQTAIRDSLQTDSLKVLKTDTLKIKAGEENKHK
jgi:PPM family protein phosphatase